MASISLKFKNIDFDKAHLTFLETVMGELGYAHLDNFEDQEKEIIECSGEDEELAEVFSSLVIALISENPEFVCSGTFEGQNKQYTAQYKDSVLEVAKSDNGNKSSASYTLEDGLFDNDDGDDFSCFFD